MNFTGDNGQTFVTPHLTLYLNVVYHKIPFIRCHLITTATTVSFSLQQPPQSPDPNLRRPNSTKSSPKPKTPSIPLKYLTTTTNNFASATNKNPYHVPAPTESTNSLASKLRLSSKLFPLPPPPILQNTQKESQISQPEDASSPEPENPENFRQDGKIFIGYPPSWIKKHEVAEFLRRFGPIKDVNLIKAHFDKQKCRF